MQPKKISHKIIGKIIAGITILVTLSLIATLTVIVLKNVITNDNTDTNMSASKIISSYSLSKTITSLSSKSYNKRTGTSANIQYKLDDKTYSINIISKQTVIFFANNLAQKNDTLSVKNQTSNFMEQNNLDKISAYSSKDKMTEYTNFTNNTAICQLTSYYPTTESKIFQSHELACENISDIKKEYLQVEKLLSIFKQTQKLSNFTEIVRTSGTKDNVSYSVLDITSDTNRNKLLFAAIDNQWVYIGDIVATKSNYTSSKYNVTLEIKEKINDQKYHGFIAQNIF